MKYIRSIFIGVSIIFVVLMFISQVDKTKYLLYLFASIGLFTASKAIIDGIIILLYEIKNK
jgi:hypothetical protein